jgi:hypothetical protein
VGASREQKIGHQASDFVACNQDIPNKGSDQLAQG